MKRILFIFLAVWFVFSVVLGIFYFPTGKSDAPTNEMSVLDAIYTRTSIRSYTDKAVEPEKIEQILRAGMSAPTARNQQPWAFVVIDDKAVMTQLADSLPYAKMLASAPVAIVVCGDLSKALEGEGATYWIQDASAATENILLAAHGLGLGAVWTGAYPVMARVKTIRHILGLPSQIIPLNVIPMGYPDEISAPKDKWKRENVRKNNWANAY
ncbi:MAG TPA: nitroreductase family protein [Candidatus Barnesiella excrementigallinarum]|nr:nitroreductase family protein [Candidatus Barnesiella excrementigallinarum]